MVEQAKLIHRSYGQRFESATAHIIKQILYICSMKKEFGKWLMDIAKYLTTAVLLSSVFNDIKESWVIYLVVSVAIVLTLLIGLLLVKDKKEEKEV